MPISNTLCIFTDILPYGTEMVPYAAQLTAVGGVSPYVWSKTTNMFGIAVDNTSSYSSCSGDLMNYELDGGYVFLTTASMPSFEFPFNGRKLSNLIVNKKGFAGFHDGTGFRIYLDDSIASYSTNDSVYYSGTTNAVTICWDTAYLNGQCTFYANGEIRFRYADEADGDVKLVANTNSTWYEAMRFRPTSADDVVFQPVNSWPEGYTLSTNGGINGISTQSEQLTFSVTVKDHDGGQSAENVILNVVANSNQCPVITSWAPTNSTVETYATVEQVFSVDAVDPDGGSLYYNWQLDGVSFGSSSNYSWTPNSVTQGVLTCYVSDSLWSNAVSRKWNVQAYALTSLSVVSTKLPSALTATAYSSELVATGGVPPYVWSVDTNTAPTGLFVSSTGSVSWASPIAGQYRFEIVVADAGGSSVTSACSLRIVDQVYTRQIGHWDMPFRGAATDVFVVSNRAYITCLRDGLWAFDISNPSNAVVLGGSEEGIFLSVFVSDSYAYVADDEGVAGHMKIIDVRDPTNLVVVGNHELSGASGVTKVYVSESYAYLAAGAFDASSNFLEIVDISNPTNPVFAGRFMTHGLARDVFVDGSFAYVAEQGASSSNFLEIVDISDPTNPVLAGMFEPAASANAVFVSGSNAYVAESSSNTNLMEVINVSNPATPVRAGCFDFGDNDYRDCTDVYISGSTAYATVAAYDGKLLLKLIDVSSPTNPVLIQTYTTTDSVGGNSLASVVVDGDYAYVTDAYSGFEIINVGEPESPTLADVYKTCGYANDISVAGNYAYIADWDADGQNSSLQIVDISNPFNPFSAGFYNTSAEVKADTQSVFVRGIYAYLADYQPGLTIVDIRDPENPVLTDRCATSNGPATAVCINGNYAYVAECCGLAAGLQIVDISNPSNAVPMGHCGRDNLADDVCVEGAYAYVASDCYGMKIVDVANPSSPVWTGVSCRCPSGFGFLKSLYVEGAYAYAGFNDVGAGVRQMEIIDISDPLNPVVTGYCPEAGAPNSIYVSNEYAFAGSSIVDVSVPSDPIVAGRHDTQGSCDSTYVDERYIYVADGQSGLNIYQYTTNTPLTIASASPQESNINVQVESSALFSVTASAANSSPVYYNWELNGTNVGHAATCTVSTAGASVGDQWQLTCRISDDTWTNAVSASWNISMVAAGCTYSVTPLSISAFADGATGSLAVDTSGTNCEWSATAGAAWITLTGATSGIGDGSVAYSVAASSSFEPRSSSISVAGRTIPVSQEGVAHPVVYITTPSAEVESTYTSLNISGTSDDAIGVITLSNPAAGFSDTIPVSSSWTTSVDLAYGENAISALASNRIGGVATSIVVITRARPPYLNCTNANETVKSSVNTFALGGVASNLTGNIAWSNAQNSAKGSTVAADSWTIDTVSLEVGSNVIHLTGANSMGETASDQVWIYRAGLPAVSATATSPVDYGTTNAALSGTAGNYVTSLWWTNALTHGMSAITPVVANWNAEVPLNVGANEITVISKNAAGEHSNVVVSVVRHDQNPILLVEPTTVNRSALFESSNVVTKTYVIRNAGGKTLSYNVGITNSGWFAGMTGSTSGALTRDQAQTNILTFDPTGLPLGNYTTNFVVTGTGDNLETNQSVLVKFLIRKAAGVSALLQLLLGE